MIVLIALITSVPVGVAATLYLSEYAPDNWLTRLINLAIVNLAGVPSIVHALRVAPCPLLWFRYEYFGGIPTLAVMTLPVVIVSHVSHARSSEHFGSLLEYGGTQQTIHHVVLPNSSAVFSPEPF